MIENNAAQKHNTSQGKNPDMPNPAPDAPSAALQAAMAAQTSAESIADALKATELRYRRLFETARDGILLLDSDQGKITDANPYMTELLGYSHEDLLGKELWEIGLLHNKEASQEAFQQLKQDHYIRYEGLPLENQRGEQRDVEFVSNLYRENGHKVIQCNIRDITERKGTQDALRSSEERLQDAQARLEVALSAGRIATWTWDLVSDRLVADASTARLFSLSPEDAAGGPPAAYFKAIHPDDRSLVAQAIEDTVAHREVYEVEYRVVLPDGTVRWLASRGRVKRDAKGRAVALPGVTVDITEQAERTQRERFLAELAERARELTEPDEVIVDAVRSVGEFLGAARCVFGGIDLLADTCTIVADHCQGDAAASIVGTFCFSDFGPFVVGEYQAGRAVAVEDVRTDAVRVPVGNVAPYEAMGIRAHITAPVVHTARLVSVIAVHSSTPRHWFPEEVELVQAVVERTWLTVEVLRQNRALIYESQQRREAHERTDQILESITDAFFALDREFRFTYLNAQAERVLSRTQKQLLGQNIWEAFPEAVGGPFYEQYRRVMAEGIPLSVEDFYPPFGAWLEVRAFPSEDGISVFFQNVNERKRLEQEKERVAERERNIASQLQQALQPALPNAVPGLAVTKYYKAALEEAGVGGDFYDVFFVRENCSALVVGDVSGKGLLAAAQVSTVRNMLRALLYSQQTVNEAMSELNRILAENNLLQGFTTLFIGMYDADTKLLKYVNGGQEPGLVRRALGSVEELGPTGPVLGTFAGKDFEARTIALAPGDAVALFSDGLTEVGRSRREMIGIEGIAALLERAVIPEEADSAASVAEHLALSLIAGVDAAAQGGVMRDDVVLLVAVVE